MAEYVEYIDDVGIIERVSIGPGTVTVRVVTDDDCGECPAARMCSVASSENKRVEVAVKNPEAYKPGDKVTLRGSGRMHRRAVVLTTAVPCIMLVAVLSMVFLVTGSQILALFLGIIVMLTYFLVLWLMRNRIAGEFVFQIVRDDKGRRNK